MKASKKPNYKLTPDAKKQKRKQILKKRKKKNK